MDAFECLSRGDAASELGADDLELLATAAYMVGRDDAYVRALERAHHAHLGRRRGPARRALRLLGRAVPRVPGGDGHGDRVVRPRAAADRARGRRLRGARLSPHPRDGGASGQRGDFEAVYSTATAAAQIAERHRDGDLLAMAVHEQGRALVTLGRVGEGLGLLDEVMVAVTAGELSPIVTGLMYCSVIDGCQEAHALRRAREWTTALSHWCEQQPEMVSFTGRCLVHRAEIMQLHGSWADALAEAERARERFEQGANPGAAGEALYRQGEVQRVRGELAAAEDAYRAASRSGREPQPGLALLRLAQGQADGAAAATRRLAAETTAAVERVAVLPAHVEVMLAIGASTRRARRAGSSSRSRAASSSELLNAVASTGPRRRRAGERRRPAPPSCRCGRRFRPCASWTFPTRPRALRCSSRSPAARSATRTARRSSSKRRATVFEQLGAAPDVSRVDELVTRARRATTPTG